jgi:exopolysaccharide biosynthesis polyprenyl glycosylphosphotransferase
VTTPKLHAPFRKGFAGTPHAAKYAAAHPKHSVWDGVGQDRVAPAARAALGWHSSYGWKLRVTDSLVIIVAITVAYMLWFHAGLTAASASEHPDGYFGTGLVLLLFWTADLELHRTRETRVVGIGATEYRRVVQSTIRVFGALAILMVVLDVHVVRGFFAIALPLGLGLLLASRWLWRQWLARQRSAGRCLSDVVVLGTADDVAYVIGQLTSNLSAGYKVVGVALTSLQEKMELRPPWYKIPVLSTMADIGRVLGVTGAQTVIVAGPLPGGPATIQELGWRLEDMSTELVLASNLTNIAGPRVHFRPVEGLPLMHVELPRYSGGKHIVKRAMDMFLAAVALLILSPVLLVLALVVSLDSQGPILFRQERVGRQGKSFKMYKFRSMVVDAEGQLAKLVGSNQGAGVLFKIANDPRITRCGTWMRKYSLDELPQFWNVLMGQMSLVGPRPPLKTEVDGYEKPAHRRLLIKPGITGLWQISGRSNLAWDEAVRLDLYYVENWSLTGDFIILWRTFKAVYDPNGAY